MGGLDCISYPLYDFLYSSLSAVESTTLLTGIQFLHPVVLVPLLEIAQ